jgi:putative transposase
LWQNRLFACVLGRDHLWPAIAYVERNPVRAGIVATAADYPWSSAAAHLTGIDPSGILDLEWWQREGFGWAEIIDRDDPESAASLRRCTYAGRPFGNQDFVDEMSSRFGRYWQRGRPAKKPAHAKINAAQFGLFAD